RDRPSSRGPTRGSGGGRPPPGPTRRPGEPRRRQPPGGRLMSEAGEGGSGGAGPDQSRPDIGGAGPGGGPRPSGLRNPSAAVRGVGAAALGAQGVTLLLAVVPLRVLDA